MIRGVYCVKALAINHNSQKKFIEGGILMLYKAKGTIKKSQPDCDTEKLLKSKLDRDLVPSNGVFNKANNPAAVKPCLRSITLAPTKDLCKPQIMPKNNIFM